MSPAPQPKHLPFGFPDQSDLTQNTCGTLTMSKHFAAFYSLGFGKEQSKGVLAAIKRGRVPTLGSPVIIIQQTHRRTASERLQSPVGLPAATTQSTLASLAEAATASSGKPFRLRYLLFSATTPTFLNSNYN